MLKGYNDTMSDTLDSPDSPFQGVLTLHLPANSPLNDDAILALSAENPTLRFEQTAEGDLIIMAPSGTQTGAFDAEITAQLVTWAKRDGRGRVFGSSTGFRLPSGALCSPDAAWVSHGQLAQLSAEAYRKFAPLCPEFVIELLSPTDHLVVMQQKMLEYLTNGAELGWLIDPENQRVYIYDQDDVALLETPQRVTGQGCVRGFVLELGDIWPLTLP
jgi:Uma2 family endonuclease